MKKIKYLIAFIIGFGCLFFLFCPDAILKPNLSTEGLGQNILDLAAKQDVIIIFNSGGWGNTPLQEAEDFAPIVNGIQKTFNESGYNSIIIPYNRTKDTLLGKMTGAKDFLNSFENSSEILSEKINFLAENLPDKKIILAGLSSGGAFATKTYEKISAQVKNSVYVIAVGTPFWLNGQESGNVIQLNNEGKDALSSGNIKSLLFSLAKAPFKWVVSKFNGQDLTFSQAVHAYGHDYYWSSPKVGPRIVVFLKEKFH